MQFEPRLSLSAMCFVFAACSGGTTPPDRLSPSQIPSVGGAGGARNASGGVGGDFGVGSNPTNALVPNAPVGGMSGAAGAPPASASSSRDPICRMPTPRSFKQVALPRR
jgi:hypothetical protein